MSKQGAACCSMDVIALPASHASCAADAVPRSAASATDAGLPVPAADQRAPDLADAPAPLVPATRQPARPVPAPPARRVAASPVAPPAQSLHAKWAVPAAAWFAQATAQLVDKARGKRPVTAQAQQEARQRAAALSTAASTVGVSFSGMPGCPGLFFCPRPFLWPYHRGHASP